MGNSCCGLAYAFESEETRGLRLEAERREAADARARAAAAAERRQSDFDRSAVGRAARKAGADTKKADPAVAGSAARQEQLARDWQS